MKKKASKQQQKHVKNKKKSDDQQGKAVQQEPKAAVKEKEAFRQRIPFYLILVLGIAVRVAMLGSVPGGMNQDEAFSAFEAHSIMTTGADSFGYHMPVYLTAWGSGMNALQSYLMIPFLAVFGSHVWAARLPQLFVSVFTLVVFYLFLKKAYTKELALIAVLFLAVCPWHIMLSRWALESNLAPGFLLFGGYFFYMGTKNTKYFLLSALFYGMSLYAYATIWTIVPVILVLQFVYLIYTKQLKFDRYVLAAAGILVLFGWPLVYFLMVNRGLAGEIRTPFFSVPKLVYLRDSEVSFAHIPENFKNTVTILWKQNDGLYWNTTEEYGLYYKYLPLAGGVIGAGVCIRDAWKSFRDRALHGSVFILIWFLCALLLGCLISVNVNRINAIHIPVICLIGIGLGTVIDFLNRHVAKHIGKICCAGMLIYFCFFVHFYFTDYREGIAPYFQSGIEQAVRYAADLAGEEHVINVEDGISYPKVLFLSEYPAEKYRNSITYTNYPSAFLDAAACEGIQFHPQEAGADSVCLINASSAENYRAAGFTVRRFDTVAVAWIQG